MYEIHTQSTVHFLIVKRAIFALLLVIAGPLYAEKITYTYDNLNRVIRSDNGGGTIIEYSYDAAGNRLSRTVSANQPPVANAGADQTVSAGVKVALDGTGSNDPDHGSSPITYSWSQTSGLSAALANATTATPDFTPLSAGTYVFQLIVNDGLTASAPDTVTITVNPVNVANQPPLASAGADQTVNAGVQVALDGSGSNDPDHGPTAITYSWSQTSGPSATLANATTATPDFTPLSAGIYVFQLIVNDGLTASAPDTVTITVNPVNVANQPPLASAGADQTVNAGVQVALDGSGSNDPDHGPSPITYGWSQTSGPSVILANPATATPGFTPLAAGTYVFQLIVNDGLTASAPDTVTITVNPVNIANQPPVANAGVDQTVNAGVQVTLDGSGSNDPDHGPSPITYSWNQTSGPSVMLANATTATPDFTPLAAGTYVFQLIVNDDLTASAADTVTITVNPVNVANQPPVANAGTDQTVNTGVNVALNGSGSNDPDHGPSPITYSWSQTSGPSVTLANPATATPEFTPSAAGTYVFQLIVNDGLTASAPDTVTITVNVETQPPLADAECLFNWAEGSYPALFAPSGSTTAILGVYSYRYYWATNAYLGVSSADNHVYYLGADGKLLDEGALSDWLPKASCQPPPPSDCLFNWAENNYPGLFAPSGSTTATLGVYSYRYYWLTNAYLGVSSTDNHVYYLGADGKLLDEGPLSDWLSKAGCQ